MPPRCAPGIEGLLRAYPQVTADVDSRYQGLARGFPGQITAPPMKPKTGATPSQVTEREAVRKQQSSRADLHRARHRRAQAMAGPAALHRPP
jgi:hypothetical protein